MRPGGLKRKYFVLKPKSAFRGDPYALASRAAMKVYANMIQGINNDLTLDLKEWILQEAIAGAACTK